MFGGVAVLLATFSLLPEQGTFIGLSSDFWRGALLGILISIVIIGRPRVFTNAD
jgi:hypothetical protein